MNTTLDDLSLFDEQDLRIEIDGPQRASIERAIPGLDGIVSIDLGRRATKLRQRGVLRAPSQTRLQARIDAIRAFIDGAAHTLATTDGQVYTHLRMDSFIVRDRRPSGPGLMVEYEIVYTQLGS